MRVVRVVVEGRKRGFAVWVVDGGGGRSGGWSEYGAREKGELLTESGSAGVLAFAV